MKPIRRPSSAPRVAAIRPSDVPADLRETAVVRALVDSDARTRAVMDEAAALDREGAPAGFGVVDWTDDE